MDTALSLFHEKGIYWSKVEDITERADIGKGTFYHYFESKEQLLKVLLHDCLEDLLIQVESALRSVKKESDVVGLAAKAHVDFFETHPDILFFLYQMRGLLQLKTSTSEDLKETYAGFFKSLSKKLKPLLPSHRQGDPSVYELAMAISFFTTGFLTHTYLFGEKIPRERQIKSLSSKLIKGIESFWK